MADLKSDVLTELERRFGRRRKLPASNSLFEFSTESTFRIYFRYSKDHGGKAFYGLRETDLRQLEGFSAVICFLWDGQAQPLFVPFDEYEDVFAEARPASDGQYKAQVFLNRDATEFYLPKVGRFNVDPHVGWDSLDRFVAQTSFEPIPALTHKQVQTILGIIGTAKGCDIWIPPNDRQGLDTSLGSVQLREELPPVLTSLAAAVSEIDAIWLDRGSGNLRSSPYGVTISCAEVLACMRTVGKALDDCCIPYSGRPKKDPSTGCNSNCAATWFLRECLAGKMSRKPKGHKPPKEGPDFPQPPFRIGSLATPGFGVATPKCVAEKFLKLRRQQELQKMRMGKQQGEC